MTKKPLSTQSKTTPIVRLTEKVGSTFLGRYKGVRDVEIRGKNIKVYEFAALDGDAPLVIKQGDALVEAEVNEGDTVAVFGTAAIDRAMEQAEPEQVLEFVFNGKKPLKGGRSFNDFSISVIDEGN